jgi:NADH-quinone oxidoreductase subunit H
VGAASPSGVGSLALGDIVNVQQGGMHHWLLFRYFPIMPVLFLVFFTASLAETNRTPFDIPEAESELVAGFHTEYSGFYFALFFLSEYTEMFVVSSVASILFLGGYLTPFPHGILQTIPFLGLGLGPFWLIAKAWTLIFVMMWLRWTLPRLRVDQLMHVAWKVLLPIALTLVVVVGFLALRWPQGFFWDHWFWWTVPAIFIWLGWQMVLAVKWGTKRLREVAA